ncbi:rho guanine nucleotide exchange factor 18 isoform X1 [Lepisosteus oculatus]|uniref:rho guanine nucleotide exchange factor 18 isoform X1 n=1 Tax=Lepisosteus oculatus TaxID=7918 RepID=UPI003710E31E
MADSPLNNSWPSFSKLWMKRWSFKRGSECKPCSREYSSVSGTGCVSPSSLSPPSIAEDVFFSSTTEEKDDSSGDTDFEDRALDIDGSIEDLLSLEPSLHGTEYFRDLGLQVPEASSLPRGLQSCHTPKLLPEPTSSSCPGSLSPAEPAAGMQEGKAVDTRESGAGAPPAAVSATAQGDPEFLEAEEPESFPILVRSMSTSRRHSWEVPVSPVDLGRRFSLDTTAMDSDGDREEDGSPETSQDQRKLSFVYPDCPTGEDEDEAGKRSRSKSVVLIAEKVSTARMSRSWEVSLQGPRAEERSTEENEPSHEEQSRIAKQRPGRGEGKEASESVTWYEFLSNENEDEEERTEKVRGATVKRRLSSLKNRVTGSFQKDKGKNREKEQQKEREKEREKEKEPKEKRRASSGHQFVPGTFSSCATCTLCSKTLVRKNGLQCLNCAVNVHKSCKNLLAECSSSKAKAKDSQYKSTGSVQNTVQYFNQASAPLREQHRSGLAAPDGSSGSARGAGMTLSQRGNTSQATASSAANHTNGPGSIAGEMDEPDALSRTKVPADDSVSLAPSAAESIIVEDGHYAALRAELEVESQDLEAESWSLAVDPQYLKKHSKDAIKRQDVIYELIQTEIHHVRTLKIMLRVYVRGMRETLQMDERKVEKIFPCVENLLDIHRHFLARLKDRRKEGLQPGSDRNYSIHSIGDVLTSEFSGEMGGRMKDSYGEFCSHHSEAVNCYKELFQSNKKFQSMIRKINNLSIVRRLGVPECILLVTQRITKYPVLVERILHNTEAGTEEHEELERALGLIKDTITQVDARVNEYEKMTRLQEVASKMEPKSSGKFKDGRVFRREDIVRRKLLHEGIVNWRAASGRLKDILALLFSDVLLLLQEKDQKYTFSTVDNKPAVISLQKLIVREVAHEEKGMFLICASSNEPEMYEIHTSSKEERNSWMAVIRQAVENCPDMEEGLFNDQEEEARAAKIKELQERLSQKDSQILQGLTDKLQIFAEIAEIMGYEDQNLASRTRLLFRGDSADLSQGEQLLRGAIAEVEILQALLSSGVKSASQPSGESQGSYGLPRRADTFGGYDSSPTILNKSGSIKKTYSGSDRPRERSQRASSDPQLKEICCRESLEQSADEPSESSWTPIWNSCFPEAEFFDRVLMLSQRLYSLQAIVSHQDSCIELQRASLPERDRPGRARGNVLLEQEKQRNFEKQREELAHFQKLQGQLRQEQRRWERERESQRLRAEEEEARLRRREEEGRRLQAQLEQQREELEQQRLKYQQDLERLRESAQAVEREKERLEQQQKRFKKHKTIANPPLSILDLRPGLTHSASFNGESLPAGAGDLGPPGKPPGRSSLSVAGADYPERPPLAKTEVPIHLISTTNQLHKQAGVQQQIPTKLALSKGKEKGSKGKASHRTDSSAATDRKQILPLKLSGKEEGTLKGRRSVSPNQNYQQEPVSPPDNFSDGHPAGIPKQNSHSSLQTIPSSSTVSEDVAKEDVIFF